MSGHAVWSLRPLLRRKTEASTLSPGPQLKGPLLFASTIANNFPDLDFLFSKLTSGPLGYLLQHRGYTHTFIFAPLQTVLILALFKVWASWRGRRWSKQSWKWLGFVTYLGLNLHIAFDSLNSYGVHPFWPFNRQWYYGDSLFIVEPMLWLTILPLLIFEARRARTRGIYSGLLAAGLGICLFSGYIPWQITLILTLWTFWLLGLMYKLSSNLRMVATVGLVLGVIGSFQAVSKNVHEAVASFISNQFPESELLDVVATPYPANPFCWGILTVERSGQKLISRQAIFANAAKFLGSAECPTVFSDQKHFFTLAPVPAPLRPELLWLGQVEFNLSDLSKIKSQYCGAAAFFKFLRAPAWKKAVDGSIVVGDLRFDRNENLNFGKIAFQAGDSCPKNIPSWDAPRRDLD